jgi:Fe-S oxidoreductase
MTPPLEREAHWLDYCTYCPKLCRHACPVSNAWPREALIPQQKMQTANLLRKGHLPWHRDYTEVLYGCTGCGACTKACAWENQPGRILLSARGVATERGAGAPALEELPERMRARGARLCTRARTDIPAARRSDDARVSFHPGCDTLEHEPEDLAAALRLFDRVAPYVRVIDGDEFCGGYPLWAAGLQDDFREHARRFAAGLAKHARVVSTCPACVYLCRTIYPQIGVPLRGEVIHVTEFLESLVPDLPSATTPEPAFYHDPCYLGRWRGVYEAPRKLLARVAKVEEFSRNRAEAECSGGGGLLPETMPEVAQTIAGQRMREPRERAARRVVTSCPTCKRALAKAAPEIEIVDLVTLLEQNR